MNGGTSIVITDTSEMERIFEGLPARFQKKVILNTFRKAAAPMRSAMRRNLPGNVKKFGSKILKAKPGKSSDKPSLTVGFFGRLGGYSSGGRRVVDIWSILYWLNYGTLARRSTSHSFKRSRKSRTANYKGGISPGYFIERAVIDTLKKSEKLAYESFSSEFHKAIQKLKP